MNKWVKILSLSILILISLLTLNEILLLNAGHLKSVISDGDLWSIERSKVKQLRDKDIILIGASRMQVNIDLGILKEKFPDKNILQLALSGRGSSYPVFEDIVKNTDFKGIIIISETQNSLIKINSEQKNIVDEHASFSLDKKLNKKIGMWFKENFLFPNPNSNSERLYGNLITKQELPVPMYTKTYRTREQTSFFDITDTKWIYKNKIDGVKQMISSEPLNYDFWQENLKYWKLNLNKFQEKGGQAIFVHMPFSSERWELENEWMPKSVYWDPAMTYLEALNIHFIDYPMLKGYELPDTSHLNANSKKEFTSNFADFLREILFLNYKSTN